MIVPYDSAAIDDLAARLDLREPNPRAVAAVADTLDSAEPGAEIVCDLATATGKTYIAAGLIDYLAAVACPQRADRSAPVRRSSRRRSTTSPRAMPSSSPASRFGPRSSRQRTSPGGR